MEDKAELLNLPEQFGRQREFDIDALVTATVRATEAMGGQVRSEAAPVYDMAEYAKSPAAEQSPVTVEHKVEVSNLQEARARQAIEAIHDQQRAA
jgi:hypothetical protein